MTAVVKVKTIIIYLLTPLVIFSLLFRTIIDSNGDRNSRPPLSCCRLLWASCNLCLQKTIRQNNAPLICLGFGQIEMFVSRTKSADLALLKKAIITRIAFSQDFVAALLKQYCCTRRRNGIIVQCALERNIILCINATVGRRVVFIFYSLVLVGTMATNLPIHIVIVTTITYV